MPKHHCCAYNCTNSEPKKKDPVKYPEVASVTFHCFPSNDEKKKQYAPGMSEQERRTRICSKHFEGGQGPSKANPVPTIFDFPKHLQRKEVKQRQDPEARRLKNTSTTNRIQKETSKPAISKVRKDNESVIGEEIGSQDLLLATPELHYKEIGDQHPLLERPQPAELNVRPKKIKDGLVYHDEAVQTDLTAE